MTKNEEDELAAKHGFRRNPFVGRDDYSSFKKDVDAGSEIAVWDCGRFWARCRRERQPDKGRWRVKTYKSMWHRKFPALEEALAGEGGEKYGYSWRDEHWENTVEPEKGVEI